MFSAALFIIAKIWKQSECLSMDEWKKKDAYIHTHVCVYIYTYIYTMKYYSAIKKDKILPFATTWTDL